MDYYYCGPQGTLQRITRMTDWWSGIEILMGQWAVFHGFAQEDLPIHRGLMVVDAKNNTVEWEDEFLRFETANDTTVWAKTPSSLEKTMAFELTTGKEMTFYSSSIEGNEKQEPLAFFQDNEYFPAISTYLQQCVGHHPVQRVEYLETDRYLLVSYFVPNGKLLDNFLLVTDHNGGLILHQCLNREQKGMSTGTFQVSHGFLSFVQDRNRMVVYQLIS